ncbi:MAG TPA: hypothetical protein VLK30_06475 [Candidatus Limnocylindrales bacterium]|nr:hypothetical protein [Candidatus Limnocylindrales bacterium]
MATSERYRRGENAAEFVPGDVILTHRHKLFAALISLAERRRFRGPDAVYAHWSHAAVIVGRDGAVVEAESLGTTRSPISKYRDDEYHLVRLGPQFTEEARRQTVAYAEEQVGNAFGYLDMLGASLYLIFGWPLRWVRSNHEICSGLVVQALQRGGLLLDLDPALSLPADIAKAFDVRQ